MGLPGSETWASIEPVEKGWSKDRKYYAVSQSGEELLVRLSMAEEADDKKREISVMEQIAAVGVIMSRPRYHGLNGDAFYAVYSWVRGESLEDALPTLSEAEQYALGIKAGRVLKTMHTVDAPADREPWGSRMRRKIGIHQSRYDDSGIYIPGQEHAKAYIEANLHLLEGRPQVLQHGDFHPGNLILTPDHEIGVIDFNRWDYGDPWEEFYKAAYFSREVSIPFTRGQIEGYFDGPPPELFYRLLALYLADIILFSAVWATQFGDKEVQGMKDRAQVILADYDNFTRFVPGWVE
jgi:serine/threonine-protein kinase